MTRKNGKQGKIFKRCVTEKKRNITQNINNSLYFFFAYYQQNLNFFIFINLFNHLFIHFFPISKKRNQFFAYQEKLNLYSCLCLKPKRNHFFFVLFSNSKSKINCLLKQNIIICCFLSLKTDSLINLLLFLFTSSKNEINFLLDVRKT